MGGEKISHFVILGKLGAGGMGEVYRAEDLNLNRQVAIKVLPDAFAADKERLARFQREAKVLASLNHPNIAAIYGLEEADGKRLLVMELIEGETLDEKIVKGPIPRDETFDFCRQVAEGLEAAHEKGIIHRDLKPSNVKVTPEGKAKILDFGLAKPQVEELAAADIAHSPTITAQMTQPGMILGTAAYMSPEQAKGRAVDKRADIWGFGCILFECLTGKKAFPGETTTECLAAVLRGEPDWSALPAGLPRSVHNLLRRCLERDPAERLRDIGEARIALKRTATAGGTGAFAPTGAEVAAGISTEAMALPVTTAAARLRRLSLPWLIFIGAASLLIGVLVGSFFLKPTRPSAASPPVASIINLEPGWSLAGGRLGAPDFWRPTRHALAISGDGRFIVYCAAKGEDEKEQDRQLFIRRAGQLEAKPIPGTERAIGPFLSPDDQWVGFWAQGKLKKAPISGGLAQEICDAAVGPGAAWGEDNAILMGSFSGGLKQVSADGGAIEDLTRPDPKRDEFSHRLPSFLPDGKGVLFTIMRTTYDLQPRIALLDRGTREWREIIEDGTDARYVSSGHILFLRMGKLMAVPFDLAKKAVRGQSVLVLPDIMHAFNWPLDTANSGAGQFSVSESGWLTYRTGGIVPDQNNSLVWVDKKGEEIPITRNPGPYAGPRLSPDGKKISLSTIGMQGSILVYDLEREIMSPLTLAGRAYCANWTPDGKRLIFSWSEVANSNLYWQPADGSGEMERLTQDDSLSEGGSWSPDGRRFAYVRRAPSPDIYVLDIRDRSVSPLLASDAAEWYPEFSPDGRWLAYCSNESGRDQVYIRSMDDGGKAQVSADGGTEPLWDRSGNQLYFRSESKLWVADIPKNLDASPGKPRLLFDRSDLGRTFAIRCYDISLDGQRFLMVKGRETKPKTVCDFVLVQDWFEELRRLVPVKK